MVRIEGVPGAMAAAVTGAPAFPGVRFTLGYPEAIGDAARSVWPPGVELQWQSQEDGSLVCRGAMKGELSYAITFTPHEDFVDARFTLTNESERTWEQSHAFNCFQIAGSPDLRDHDAVRHYVGQGGRPVRIREVPRAFSPRPTIQLYQVEGAPAGRDLPFVANFRATPDVTLEGWMAVVSLDGRRLAATVARPALYLFQNLEYSCIHAATSFGRLAPGQTGAALNRCYFVEATLEQWHERMKREMA